MMQIIARCFAQILVLFWFVQPFALSADEKSYLSTMPHFLHNHPDYWILWVLVCLSFLFLFYFKLLFSKKIQNYHLLAIAHDNLETEARNLIDLTDTGLVFLDQKGRILEANDSFLKILGQKKISEIKGKELSDWMELKSKSHFKKVLDQCQQNGYIKDYECTCKQSDGSKVYILINAHLSQYSNIPSISALCKDITAIKKVEFELRQNEVNLRAVMNISPATIFILSPGLDSNCPLCNSKDKCILHLSFVSSSIKDITGYSEDEYLSDSSLWLERVHPEDVDKLRESYYQIFTQSNLDNQYRYRHKNGDYRWLNVKMIIINNEEGEINQVIGSMMDISDIIHAREQVEKLSSAVEQSPCPIFITDTEGKIEYANAKLMEITGLTESEVIGHTPKIFASGHTDKNTYQELWKTICSGEKWYGTIQNKDINGQYIWVKEAIAPIRNTRNEITHFVAIQEDISNIISNSEELKLKLKKYTEKIKTLEYQRSEQQKSVAIGRMAAWVAHEINNPLAGIYNSFQLLKHAIPKDHQYFRYVDLIDNEISRISLITKQLYSLYKQEDIKPHQFDCNEIIEEIILLCTSGQNSVNINHVTETNKCYVTLQENLIRQIFFNLIKNAIDHSPEKGTIIISAIKTHNQLKVTIENDGAYIPEDELHKLLEPFYSTKTDTQYQGLGLGLTIVNSAVKLMQGELNLKNKISGGLIIELNIPLKYYNN